MDIQLLFSALALASALGLVVGSHFGVAAWIAVGAMLLATSIGSGLLAGLGWQTVLIALVALLPAFNAGLVAALALRPLRQGSQPS